MREPSLLLGPSRTIAGARPLTHLAYLLRKACCSMVHEKSHCVSGRWLSGEDSGCAFPCSSDKGTFRKSMKGLVVTLVGSETITPTNTLTLLPISDWYNASFHHVSASPAKRRADAAELCSQIQFYNRKFCWRAPDSTIADCYSPTQREPRNTSTDDTAHEKCGVHERISV
jgi:hypothetical protein